ncbi:MAG TPA: TolC family protein, partial [Casimicrobiaceae bacterium]|nr:TolC family protein [Casimicrobiaceae bacterium]
MMRFPPAVLACFAVALAASASCAAEDLMDVYREAQRNDPTVAAARANWEATQERVPQARAGLLPNVSLSVSANANYFGTNIDSDPHVTVNRNFGFGGLTVSAAQPLYRYANTVAYSQAVEEVRQADYTLT